MLQTDTPTDAWLRQIQTHGRDEKETRRQSRHCNHPEVVRGLSVMVGQVAIWHTTCVHRNGPRNAEHKASVVCVGLCC